MRCALRGDNIFLCRGYLREIFLYLAVSAVAKLVLNDAYLLAKIKLLLRAIEIFIAQNICCRVSEKYAEECSYKCNTYRIDKSIYSLGLGDKLLEIDK